MTIGEAREKCLERLAQKFGLTEGRSITRILFEDFFAYYTTEKDPGDFGVENQNHLFYCIERILDDHPVQYLTNNTYFFGKKYFVNEAVLIPRSETEELVEWVLETLKQRPELSSLLDLGTGSGCIPIALKIKMPRLQIEACDISPEALAVAKKNATQLQADVRFFEADILGPDALSKAYDVMVSNPPYIPKSEWSKMDTSVRLHEPEIALFASEANPVQFYEAILQLADNHLRQNGLIFVEINEFLANETMRLFDQSGYQTQLRQDLQGKPRMIRASRR